MRRFILGCLITLLLPVAAFAQGINNPGYPPGQIPGTATNDNAAVGRVGEYISSTVLVGSGIALTDATNTNITSISLTAGDWDVWGTVVSELGVGATMTSIAGWTSATSATLPTRPNNGAISIIQTTFGANAVTSVPVNAQRVSLSATTTIYLSARSLFTGGTNTAYGFIGARRAR